MKKALLLVSFFLYLVGCSADAKHEEITSFLEHDGHKTLAVYSLDVRSGGAADITGMDGQSFVVKDSWVAITHRDDKLYIIFLRDGKYPTITHVREIKKETKKQ